MPKLDHTDISGAKFGKITAPNIHSALGENIWRDDELDFECLIDDNIDEEMKEEYDTFYKVFMTSDGFKFAEDENEYENSLTSFLIKLACSNRWTAFGVFQCRIRTLQLKIHFVQRFLDLKGRKDNSGLAICSGLSEIKKNIATFKIMIKNRGDRLFYEPWKFIYMK